MKERPILMTGENVLAILDDRKTQTRRIIKPQPKQSTNFARQQFEDLSIWNFGKDCVSPKNDPYNFYVEQTIKCPYGKPCDRLWVRETFKYYGFKGGGSEEYGVLFRADLAKKKIKNLQLKLDCQHTPWTPSIFMSREFSRIDLLIKDIGVERIQDISEEDAKAEGVKPDKETGSYADSFMILWDKINYKRGFGWDKNLFLWVIEFERIGNDY